MLKYNTVQYTLLNLQRTLKKAVSFLIFGFHYWP